MAWAMRVVVLGSLAAGLAACTLLVSTDGLSTDAADAAIDAPSLEGGPDAGADAAGGLDAEAEADAGDPFLPGLVAWYRFEEASGADAVDSSGNGNTGTAHPGVGRGPGKVGNAATFDGVGWFSVADAPSLALGSAITVAAWINLQAVSYDQRIASCVAWDVKLNSRYPQIATNAGYATSKIAVPPNEWHHVALRVDGGSATVYVDGVQVELGADTLGGPAPMASGPIGLGAQDNGGSPAKGSIDELRIWNRALDPSLIAALAR